VGAQIIFPKSGRGLASRSVQWGTCFCWVHRCRPEDKRRLMGCIVCVIT